MLGNKNVSIFYYSCYRWLGGVKLAHLVKKNCLFRKILSYAVENLLVRLNFMLFFRWNDEKYIYKRFSLWLEGKMQHGEEKMWSTQKLSERKSNDPHLFKFAP